MLEFSGLGIFHFMDEFLQPIVNQGRADVVLLPDAGDFGDFSFAMRDSAENPGRSRHSI